MTVQWVEFAMNVTMFEDGKVIVAPVRSDGRPRVFDWSHARAAEDGLTREESIERWEKLLTAWMEMAHMLPPSLILGVLAASVKIDETDGADSIDVKNVRTDEDAWPTWRTHRYGWEKEEQA